jgi:asparagine synthase (glutamine-hydrolysing)
MCGIALLLGASLDGSDHRRFDVMVRGIEQRGESLEEERSDHALVATSRLKIVDRQHAIQPWRTGSGRHALCYNGEVFNFGSLRDRLVAEGVVLRSWSDTEVVAEAIAAWGTDALLQFRGEFAIALVDHDDGSVFLARDPAGVKPLYWARTGGRLHVASEVKALTGLGVPVTEVPPGHCGTGFADRDPELHPYIDLLELGTGEPMLDTVEEATSAVRATFIESVRRRVDTDLPVGIILSGGGDPGGQDPPGLCGVHCRDVGERGPRVRSAAHDRPRDAPRGGRDLPPAYRCRTGQGGGAHLRGH